LKFLSPPTGAGPEASILPNLPSFAAATYLEGMSHSFAKGKGRQGRSQSRERVLRSSWPWIPGARQVGEFSLTDKAVFRIDRFMAETLFDENFAGSREFSHCAWFILQRHLPMALGTG